MFSDILFYIIWAILSLLPLMIAAFAPETVKEKIIACLCVLVITCGITAMMFHEDENAVDRWNDGICKCGGTYEFSACSQYRTSEYFYYTCDTCGHTEEFPRLMK